MFLSVNAEISAHDQNYKVVYILVYGLDISALLWHYQILTNNENE